MKSRLILFVWMLIFIAGTSMVVFGQNDPLEKEGTVHVITIDGSINPGSADFIIRSIQSAKSAGVDMFIIELDTPGGLVESTLDIVTELLKSEIPVVVYVSPPGARAGSAGAIITLAADIAAMAPATNIGAASPVSSSGEMDETMKSKVTNDLASKVESIAERRGRNKEWAIKAVREASAITSTHALKINVIDVIAENLPELLEQLDGREVKLTDKTVKLNVKNAKIVRVEMGWKHKLLNLLADPNLAYLFMIIGMLGIYAEFSHPGLIVPGVIGAVCIILFLVASQVLPINTFGIMMILLGLVFFILEFKFTSYGGLTITGLVCLTVGSLFLFDVPEKVVNPNSFSLQVSWSYIVPSVAVLGSFVIGITYLIVKTQRRKPETMREGIIGRTGVAATDFEPGKAGKVEIVGELWKAEADEPIAKGEKVVAIEASSSSLELKVKKYLKE